MARGCFCPLRRICCNTYSPDESGFVRGNPGVSAKFFERLRARSRGPRLPGKEPRVSEKRAAPQCRHELSLALRTNRRALTENKTHFCDNAIQEKTAMAHTTFPKEILRRVREIGEMLRARGYTLGTAESCTGGLIAAACTDVPGSSAWFRGSVVSYANAVKIGLLGVDAKVLAAGGAVSGPVAEAMARGALFALGADLCVAVSGIAGPDGGSAAKPVGTVWAATALRLPGCAERSEVRAAVRHHIFSGNRSEIRHAALPAALAMVEEALEIA